MRNLCIRIRLAPWPYLVWVKSTGPGDDSPTATAISKNSGDKIIKPIEAPKMSSIRFDRGMLTVSIGRWHSADTRAEFRAFANELNTNNLEYIFQYKYVLTLTATYLRINTYINKILTRQ